jgi:hypothetical protein
LVIVLAVILSGALFGAWEVHRAALPLSDRGLLALLLTVGLILGAFWYFTVYDTAQGKCGRGDPAACWIWQQQQTQP